MTSREQNPSTGFYPGQAPQYGTNYNNSAGAPPYPGYGEGSQPVQPPYPSQPGQPQAYPPPAGFVVPPQGPYPSGSPPGPAMYGSSSSDYGKEPIIGDDNGSFEFSDKTIRRGFIRKVYSILMCQLVVTSAIIALFTYHEPTKNYVQTHSAIFWIAFGVTIVTIIIMACCGDVRRTAPMNFIFLGIFTFAEAVLLGTMASMFNAEEVLMAAGLTAAICFALTLFAFQTKWDFTMIGGGLFVALILLMIFGIVAIFVPGKTISMIYASLGALLFSLYLIYDTQIMMGGKHKFAISPEEYIFAALNLYLDIVNIFIYILSIIGLARD